MAMKIGACARDKNAGRRTDTIVRKPGINKSKCWVLILYQPAPFMLVSITTSFRVPKWRSVNFVEGAVRPVDKNFRDDNHFLEQ